MTDRNPTGLWFAGTVTQTIRTLHTVTFELAVTVAPPAAALHPGPYTAVIDTVPDAGHGHTGPLPGFFEAQLITTEHDTHHSRHTITITNTHGGCTIPHTSGYMTNTHPTGTTAIPAIVCDHPGCNAHHPLTGPTLGGHDWHTSGTGDYCPNHHPHLTLIKESH